MGQAALKVMTYLKQKSFGIMLDPGYYIGWKKKVVIMARGRRMDHMGQI